LHLNILFQGFLYSFYNNHVFETTIPFLHTIKIPRYTYQTKHNFNHKKRSNFKEIPSGITISIRTHKKQQFQQNPETKTPNYDKKFKIKKTFEAEKEYPAEKSNLYQKK
jgi:hypothetical protein